MLTKSFLTPSTSRSRHTSLISGKNATVTPQLWWEHPISQISFTIGCCLLIWSFQQSGTKVTVSTENISRAKQVVSQLQAEKESLELAINQAQTPLAREKQLRNELLQQKPGEIVFQIPNAPTETKPTQLTDQVSPQELWQKWWLNLWTKD